MKKEKENEKEHDYVLFSTIKHIAYNLCSALRHRGIRHTVSSECQGTRDSLRKTKRERQ